MVELTVGYAASIIAALVTLVRLWAPNTLVYILSGILGDKNTAVTWSVAGRALQSSLWPDLLRTDAALARGVRWDVRVIVKSIQLMIIMIAVAGVITPLGLYSEAGFGRAMSPRFQHARDESSFGIATPPRSNLSFNRECNWGGPGPIAIPEACPYTEGITILNETHFTLPNNLTREIPDILKEIYSSGTTGWPNTIANYFDIEWRQYSIGVSKYYNNGTAFLTSGYRQMESLIMRNEIMPVEGLLVDLKDGGLGFRNHTLPTALGVGCSWEEDILFIQPETVCVDTNLSLAFSVARPDINRGSVEEWENVRLIDNGGFANLNQTYPYYALAEAQTNPDLQGRAYKAAWLNNVYSAAYFNVTNPGDKATGRKAWQYLNSNVGKEFPLNTSSLMKFRQFDLSDNFGSYLDSSYETDTKLGNPLYSNPFEISSVNFSTIALLCRGAGNADIVNISTIVVECGMMRGAAIRVDGGSSLLFEAESQWKVPLYTCATAVKATIKTTSFLLNGTSGLSSLSVTKTRPKEYPNTENLPLWAVEDSGRIASKLKPIWGLIGPDYAKFPNMSVVKKESLYLPGWTGGTIGLSNSGYDNLPGSDFAGKALISTYSEMQGSVTSSRTDYTGFNNMPLYVKWQNFSSNPVSAAKIANLIWTDLSASAVMGTKSSLGGRTQFSGPVPIVVRPIVTQLRYRWVFAIPAFIVLLLCAGIATLALVTFIFHHHNFAKLRKHLQQTSVGRILTSFVYPEYSSLKTSTQAWNQSVGKNVVDLGGDNPLMTLLAQNNFYKGSTPVGAIQPGIDPLNPGEKGVASHEREVIDANERLISSRVPSPYQGANGEQESYPLTGLSSPPQYGFRE